MGEGNKNKPRRGGLGRGGWEGGGNKIRATEFMINGKAINRLIDSDESVN